MCLEAIGDEVGMVIETSGVGSNSGWSGDNSGDNRGVSSDEIWVVEIAR